MTATATARDSDPADDLWTLLCTRLRALTSQLAPRATVGQCRPALFAALLDPRLVVGTCRVLEAFVNDEADALRATLNRLSTDPRVLHTVPAETLLVLLLLRRDPEWLRRVWTATRADMHELDAISSAFAAPYR